MTLICLFKFFEKVVIPTKFIEFEMQTQMAQESFFRESNLEYSGKEGNIYEITYSIINFKIIIF